MGMLAPTDLRQWPSEREYMPLLRSLADRTARVAINMALLTELFASLPPPLGCVKDACKEQSPRALWVGPVRYESARGLAHSKTWRHFGRSMTYFGLGVVKYFAGSASNSCLQLSLQKK